MRSVLMVIGLVILMLLFACSSPSENRQEVPLPEEEPVLKGNSENATDSKNETEVQPQAQQTEATKNLSLNNSEPNVTVKQSLTPPKFTIIEPKLTYPDAYNGPLFDTSLQIGSSGTMDKYFRSFDRNGMNFFIGYFKIDFPPEKNSLVNNLGFGYLLEAVQKHPHRVIPYISLSYESEDVPEILGEEMTTRYTENLNAIHEIVGKDLIRGFGELEIMDYAGYGVNSPELKQIYDLAQENDIEVMFHPKTGQIQQIKETLEKYPDITFLIHMFPEDFSQERTEYINLLTTHDNLYFSVDVDHMSFDGDHGLLYKYEKLEINRAVTEFITDYDRNEQKILATAVARYKPLIDAVPEKVMWGTEMGPKYNFEPTVYDRIIKFSRLFIGKLNLEHQEAFAYKNAQRVFGPGAKLNTSIPLEDASSWPICPGELDCEKCDSFEEETPQEERCLSACAFVLKCIDDVED